MVKDDSMQNVDSFEDLFVFGYSCKIFPDDEKARYINQKKHLIPWMEDESLMIDRYDGRGYLHDLKQYEPNVGLQIDEQDLEEEKLCDEERYRFLHCDISEEQLYQEEELKRFRAAVASDGAYHEIGFSYDDEGEIFNEPEGPEEEAEEPYEPPSELNIVKGMEVPCNMKIHTIIEKTAAFVSEHGGQIEIIIKMKQQNNPQFGFMYLDNPLYPYYKFLLKEIKSGSYKPVETKRVSESEDEDDHYLHPSLLAGKKENVPKFTVPSIKFRHNEDDSYSVLVRNLQQLAEEKIGKGSPKEKDSVPEIQHRLVNYNLEESQINDSLNNSYTAIVIPPSEIQPIIQKMAEYVAKNGEDFEYVVKSKNDKRFEFVQPSSEYYPFYIHMKDQSKLQLQPPQVAADISATVPTEKCTTFENYNLKSTDINEMQVNYSTSPFQSFDIQEVAIQPNIGESDALYTQYSQDLVFNPEPQSMEVSTDELSNSVDSVGIPKASKVLKGPICFSLKAKDVDSVPTAKLKIPLLLDDSDEDSNEEATKEKDEFCKRIKSTEENRSVPTTRHDSVERVKKPKLTSEMEAKLAEERMKDKLLSAARERIVQQRKEERLEMKRQEREEQLKKEKQLQKEQQHKEKQLQLERKKKAALFLNMLKSRNNEVNSSSSRLGGDKKSKLEKAEFSNFANASGSIASKNDILFPLPKITNIPSSNLQVTIPGIKSEWSQSSPSEESGEEIMITEFCSELDPVPVLQPTTAPVPGKIPKPEHRHKHKKKKKKQSHSKNQERHYKSSRSRDRHHSRSPRSYKHKKSRREKELPTAYALVNRSRSRSHSPRHYRQNPRYWNRRR